MNRWLGGLWCVGLLACVPLLASAQTATVTKRVATPQYDVSKEVTLEGSVTNIAAFVPGNIPGGHMVVSTSKGTIDGHLGPYALRGKNRISIPPGTRVKMTGAMATVRGNPIFLVRTIDTGATTYTIRSVHGFLLIPGAGQPTKSINFVSPKGGR
jgi:hypothetical protein